jgi:hypothetical protein
MGCCKPSSFCFMFPLLAVVSGCFSPYYQDRGTLVGGATGAGVGALVGEASGHPGVGALIGAGVGAVTGNAIGAGMDDIAARNRAEIAARMGRPIPPGAVSINDVIAMTKSGVDEELIVNHIRASGMARPLQANELIILQQEGVSKQVIQSMQMPSAPPGAGGPPMMAQDPYYGAPGWGPYPGYYYPPPYAYPYPYPYPPPYAYPRVGFGFSVRSGRR